MYRPLAVRSGPAPNDWDTIPQIARSGQLEALIALDRIGSRLHFSRDEEIYAQGNRDGAWYKVVSGVVRISKLRADGRRHIAAFAFSGEAFGLESAGERAFSAEAIGEVMVMRYPWPATKRLTEENPAVTRYLCEMAQKSLAAVQNRLILLGRMTACERVASFLLELFERDDAEHIDVAMSRCDIGDYLGLTTETVCRVLSDLKRRGIIAVKTHAIDLRNRASLEAIGADPEREELRHRAVAL
jgi:CRP/FNR family transcriptional regulator, nitrogen fixation regulation protein